MDSRSGFVTFVPLHCPKCHGEAFARIIGLSSREGSGTVETQQGYMCLKCLIAVDIHEMQTGAHVELLRQQLMQKQAELNALMGGKDAS